MAASVVVLLVLTTLIIAAAAIGLSRVIEHLVVTEKTLTNLIGGLNVVADQTSTVGPVLTSVNANLKPVRDFCEGI